MIVVIYSVIFFFFKQKTAYEMRISDWSSDVCSSDLDKNFKIPCIGRLPVIFKRGTAGSHGPILYVLQLVFKIVRGRVDTECVRFCNGGGTRDRKSVV